MIGLVIALPLGWLARRYRWVYPPMLSITGLLYTIPSIALFVLVPPLLGLKALDPLQVPIALTVYSVALLVRVVADGLGSVPEDVLQAATAMGFGRLQRLFRVELPIAVPVIAAGLRVATVSNVSMSPSPARSAWPTSASSSPPASSCRRRPRTTRRSCSASSCASRSRSPSTARS